MDLAALKTELTDAAYAELDDVEAAELLNAPGKSLDIDSLDMGLVLASMTVNELSGLTAQQRLYVQSLASVGTVPFTPTLKSELQAALPTAVKQRILPHLNRTGSRADELGLGNVTPSHVADARRL